MSNNSPQSHLSQITVSIHTDTLCLAEKKKVRSHVMCLTP